MNNLSCPQCGSPQIKRNGHTHYGKQNHQCLECGRQFVSDSQLINEQTRELIKRLLMNDRAASSAVSKQVELSVPRYPALSLDVTLDHLLIPMCADRRDEIPVRPELAAPQVLFHRRAAAEDFSRRQTLDNLDDPFRAVHRHRLHQEMDVV